MNNKQQKKTKTSIQQLQSGINKITQQLKELQGPMARTLRTALKELDVELTVYWAGQFVGPQI